MKTNRNPNLKRNIFFTSDWHVGHENCINFDNRPFRDIHHMHDVLVNNYNASVTDDDVCYFLGDMGMNKRQHVEKIVARLNGTKVMILGNHDKGVNSMYRAGFDVVMFGATLFIANQVVTLSHCPLRGIKREDTAGMRNVRVGDNWHGESKAKIHPYTREDVGQYHLHGHIHSSPDKSKSKKILNKQYDVGVVANKYRPVSQGQIESWIASREQLY